MNRNDISNNPCFAGFKSLKHSLRVSAAMLDDDVGLEIFIELKPSRLFEGNPGFRLLDLKVYNCVKI